MFTRSNFLTKLLYPAVAVAVFLASFFKIADLDFWWHLKTGELILKGKALIHTEIYSYSAAGREYIDHEWLFQVVQFLAFSKFGEAGVILLKCGILILLYLLVTRHLLQNKIAPLIALSVILLSVCAARIRFIERPEIFTALFLVITYIAIDRFLSTGRLRTLFAIPPVVVIWSNMHAAVILGLILQLVFLFGLIAEKSLEKQGYPSRYKVKKQAIAILAGLFLLTFLLTGLNPYGYRMLMVPFELTALIDSGLLNNQEWQQPSPLALPFFYAALLFTFSLHAINFRNLHLINFLFSAFLGYISLKYVRNVGLFSMMMPLLISGYLPALSPRKQWAAIAAPGLGLCLILLVFYQPPFEWGIGRASYFPADIVRFTERNNLKGNMLNSYGFGGYLIWEMYPERKIFIDGRNEVYLPLLQEVMKVNADNLNWKKFLEKYDVQYALLNYIDDLEEVKIVDKDRQIRTVYAPFTSTHFPRKGWALVYWDDNGMVLVKRQGVNRHVLNQEYVAVYPEGHNYQKNIVRQGVVQADIAIRELKRRVSEQPASRRANHLLNQLISSVQQPEPEFSSY